MRLSLQMIIPAATLALALACGDDDGDKQTGDGDDNGEGGIGGGNEEPMCKGVYAAWTAAELGSATTAGACEDDTASVCGRDLNLEAGIAGKACFAQFPNDPQGLAECALTQLKENAPTNPSDACLGCYLASVACVQERCLEDCLSDPGSQLCITCRAEQGCTQEFFECSGLPAPTPAPSGD